MLEGLILLLLIAVLGVIVYQRKQINDFKPKEDMYKARLLVLETFLDDALENSRRHKTNENER